MGYEAIAGAATKQVYAAIGEQSYANRQERKMLKDDVKKMQNNELGYSDAQRNTLAAGQNRQSSAQTADAMAQMQRSQNAAGTGRAGGYDTQRGQMLASQQAAGAQYNAGVEQASSQLAQNQRADILRRLNAQTTKTSQFWKERGDTAQEGSQQFGSIGGGGNSTDWASAHEGNE